MAKKKIEHGLRVGTIGIGTMTKNAQVLIFANRDDDNYVTLIIMYGHAYMRLFESSIKAAGCVIYNNNTMNMLRV